MTDADTTFRPGLEGVIAFETEIAEPDKEGGALRYRGIDITDLVGHVSFGNVWGLLVDDKFNPGLPPAEPFPLPVHTCDVRVDVQSALARLAQRLLGAAGLEGVSHRCSYSPRCSTMGPSASAGKSVSPATISVTPTTRRR